MRHFGSSPLSRGIQAMNTTELLNGGIIPALAGNTPAKACTALARRDHPRSRGEYSRHGAPLPFCRGSSPLSRGIRGVRLRIIFPFRIIPALAGNTLGMGRRRRPRADHPRSRGEYSCSSRPRPTRQGSSPLSRGIRAVLVNSRHAREDHPRSRGEYITFPLS